jgi:hypothetical protein
MNRIDKSSTCAVPERDRALGFKHSQRVLN